MTGANDFMKTKTHTKRKGQRLLPEAPCSALSKKLLWDICELVMLQEDGRPLELWRVAKVTGMDECKIIAALIHETGVRRQEITFRYPPLPRAAITAIGAIGPNDPSSPTAGGGKGGAERKQ